MLASVQWNSQPEGVLNDKATLFRVHLVDEATVVERGEQVRVWFLAWRDSWTRAKDHPAAELELSSADEGTERCPPGTIWQRKIELSLPLGTALLSRVTSPLFERMNPVEYLTRDRRGVRRHVAETWFTVAGNYRLTRGTEPEAFARARAARRNAETPRTGRDGSGES